MPYRRSGRYYGRRAPARQKDWIRTHYTGPGSQTTDASHDMLRPDAQSPLAISTSFVIPTNITVIRVRGWIGWEMGALGINNWFAYGLIMGTPETDDQNPARQDVEFDGNKSDWLWWEMIPQAQQTAIVQTTSTYMSVRAFDIRAKRKARDLEDTLMLYWKASEPISEVRAVTSTLYLNP